MYLLLQDNHFGHLKILLFLYSIFVKKKNIIQNTKCISKFNAGSICTNDKKAVFVCSYTVITQTLYHDFSRQFELLEVSCSRVHTKNCNQFSRTFKDFSRTTLDFQEPPTRNVISQTVQKYTFVVYSNKTLRLGPFFSPTSLHFSVLVNYCISHRALYVCK